MLTVNLSKRFQALLPSVVRYRATVEEVDVELNRAFVSHGASTEWVTLMISANVGNDVMVEDGRAVRLLPDLPYSEMSVV